MPPFRPLPAAAAALLLLAACGANTGGVRGYPAFRATATVTDIDARIDLATFASCFRDRARFLPFSAFERTEDRFVYLLRADDLWLESMVVTATPDGISGEFLASGLYDDGWRAILERDRLPALAACVE